MEDTSKWERRDSLLYFFILILGIALRFYLVDDRPVHHDESLHGMYSLYYLENSKVSFYKYDPLLHGPLLYHIVPWFFHFLGITKFALRLPAVLLGSSLLFLPLVFKKYLSKSTVLFIGLVMAISPTLTYWSRFIRHDGFVLFGILLCLFSIFKVRGTLKGLLFGLGLALQFCAKENSFIHLSFILVFLGFEFLLFRFFDQAKKTEVESFLDYAKEYPLGLIGGFIVFGLVFSHYYSAGFIYPEGILDGLYRKSLFYWMEQHQQERITGPFSYSFLINSFFESWWIAALLLHLCLFYKRHTTIIKIGFLSSFAFAGITHFMMDEPFIKEITSTYLKLKIPLDYYLFYPLIYHAVTLTATYLLEGKKGKALTGFLFFSSLFTYSFVGEKVPWLAIYPCLSGLLFFGFEFDRTFHKPIIPVLLILLAHTAYTNHWTNFKAHDNPQNILTQVHTTREFENTFNDLRSQMESHSNGKGPFLLVRKGITWPTTWYLHGRKEYHYQENLKPLSEYQFVLTEPLDGVANQTLRGPFHREIIPLRSWWVPDYKKMNLKNLWGYFLRKENWNSTGSQNVALWIKSPTPQSKSK